MKMSSPLPTSDGDRSAQRLRVDCLAAFQIGEQQSGGGELTDQL